MIRTGNERTGNRLLDIPVKGGEELTEATMAVINAEGYAETATAAAGLLIAGCVQSYCDNRNGADGEQTASVKRGTFVWENDGTPTPSRIRLTPFTRYFISRATTRTPALTLIRQRLTGTFSSTALT